ARGRCGRSIGCAGRSSCCSSVSSRRAGWASRARSGKRNRAESEWYVKPLGQVTRNWARMLRGGPLCDVNFAQLGRVIADHLPEIAKALRTARQKRKTVGRTFAQAFDEFVLPA